MKKTTRFVGLDVHKDTIAVAVAEPDGEVRSLGTIPNDPEAVRKLRQRLGPQAAYCYEAGPCGYVLYWQLTGLGAHCEVIAPTLIPVKPGDRVKTDRRDAEKLARCFRAGDLTAVWVPDADHEALRELVRTRYQAKADQRRVRARLKLFLLRRGIVAPKASGWTAAYRAWLATVTFTALALRETWTDLQTEVAHVEERLRRLEQALDAAVAAAPPALRAVVAALQTLRGVAPLTAVTVAVEAGRLSRFDHPRRLMAFSGLVPSEHSTGGPGHARRGAITKTGNARLRTAMIEAALAYCRVPAVGKALRQRQAGQDAAVLAISWKAQKRLHTRYRRLVTGGKPHQLAITAVARELLGFIWAVGCRAETATAAGAAGAAAGASAPPTARTARTRRAA